MIGSIIGDIVGSVYEFANIKTKEFPLFGHKCNYTDDTVMSVATADWLLHGGHISHYFAVYGAKYRCPKGGYGGGFHRWLRETNSKGYAHAYNSCGNGAAMRVGPVGWIGDKPEPILEKAYENAVVTHNHPEGIKGAQAVALAIYYARHKAGKKYIRAELMKDFGYDLNFTCDDIRDTYTWGSLCQDTVPQAIVAFLDSTDFEDSIRNAVSLGGDSDTLACIAGSIAEAHYGVPDTIREKAMSYLPDDFKKIVTEFEAKYNKPTL